MLQTIICVFAVVVIKEENDLNSLVGNSSLNTE